MSDPRDTVSLMESGQGRRRKRERKRLGREEKRRKSQLSLVRGMFRPAPDRVRELLDKAQFVIDAIPDGFGEEALAAAELATTLLTEALIDTECISMNGAQPARREPPSPLPAGRKRSRTLPLIFAHAAP